MKKWERPLVYCIAFIAIAYSFHTHNKLQVLSQPNSSQELQKLENLPFEDDYLKIRQEVLNSVVLERFEVTVEQKRLDEWDFGCHRWVRNPLSYAVKTKNIVKFYSHNGTMMKWENFYANEPFGTDYPQESKHILTLPISIAELVDCNQTELMFRPCYRAGIN